HARDHEGDLFLALAGAGPVGEGADVALGDLAAVDVAQHRLEDDADRYGELGDGADAGRLELRERVELSAFSVAEGEGIEGGGGVMRHSGGTLSRMRVVMVVFIA